MITDKQRREVARKLREDAANDKLREQVFVEEIIVGCVGETMHDEWGNVREIEILTRLADLIDRPTCHDVTDLDRESFKCSRCGYRVLSIDGAPDAAKLVSPKGGVVDFGYCPNCGAEVQE